MQKKIRFQIAWNRLGMNGNANGMVLMLHVKLTTYLFVVLIFVMFLTFQGFQCLRAGLTENNVCRDKKGHNRHMFQYCNSFSLVSFVRNVQSSLRFLKCPFWVLVQLLVNLICTTFVGCDTHNTILLF